ncbi:MAG: hypothetical protein H8E10_06725 [Desulfobacterales bacterium]|jgi:predicted aldo/keto reductase-like oxidoreductase|nr:hypothetical protein [Desulfobacterales bacterium]MBL7174130.1 hypothetical protein [Desulfobacteraceae bacterium]MBU0735105.1 hypothetical protein [Pseudomonadota bacterium]
MDFTTPATLGRTGLKAGRLGVAASYGAPTEAFEEAFEKGCNYFYWGSKRTKGMGDAIKNICGKGMRDDLIILIQSYSRSAMLMETFLKRALKAVKLDYADILLLGWHNKLPAQRLVDKALALKEKGLCRFIAMSGHKRTLFPKLEEAHVFDLFHIRYNAAHRGAEKETFPYLKGDWRPGIVTYTATRWAQLVNGKKMPPGEFPLSAPDCYRFVLTNPAVDVCMCGPKDTAQMREALRTLELGPLNDDELERIRRIGDHVHDHAGKFF